MLTRIIDKIRITYERALIDPGTAIGIIAAQSFSEPLTQYVLDAHHRSATGGTSKNGMTRAKEIMGAKDVHKLKSPSMLIPVHSSIAENKSRVQEIANNIEMMSFRQFVVLWQVFFEKYGEPIHTDYKHEKLFIEEFAKINPLLRPPGDLTKWCVRMQINRTTLILKNMALDLIITKLREVYPETYIICSPENSPDIVIRIYLRSAMFKSTVTQQDVILLVTAFLDTIIRGVDGIVNTTVVKMLRHKITDDGSILRNDNLWGISTNGTNMHGILATKFIDKYNVQTDAIQEVYRMFGIEAARQKIMSELRELVDICNHRHYMVYADEMTFTGRVTSIESSGLRAREASNILLITGFSNPLSTLENAAVNSLTDHMVGISSPLMVGSVPLIGTLYNKFHIDTDFVRKHIKRPDDILDTLFD